MRKHVPLKSQANAPAPAPAAAKERVKKSPHAAGSPRHLLVAHAPLLSGAAMTPRMLPTVSSRSPAPPTAPPTARFRADPSPRMTIDFSRDYSKLRARGMRRWRTSIERQMDDMQNELNGRLRRSGVDLTDAEQHRFGQDAFALWTMMRHTSERRAYGMEAETKCARPTPTSATSPRAETGRKRSASRRVGQSAGVGGRPKASPIPIDRS